MKQIFVITLLILLMTMGILSAQTGHVILYNANEWYRTVQGSGYAFYLRLIVAELDTTFPQVSASYAVTYGDLFPTSMAYHSTLRNSEGQVTREVFDRSYGNLGARGVIFLTEDAAWFSMAGQTGVYEHRVSLPVTTSVVLYGSHYYKCYETYVLRPTTQELLSIFSGSSREQTCVCNACCICRCRCGIWDDVGCLGVSQLECEEHGRHPHLPGESRCCECHFGESSGCDHLHGSDEENGNPGNYVITIEKYPDFEIFDFYYDYPYGFELESMKGLVERHFPPLPSFEWNVTPFDGHKEFTKDTVQSKAFEGFDWGDEDGDGDKEKADLKYFDRTGDFTVSLKFKEVFNDLLDAVGAHLPVDFVRNLYENTQGGISASEIPLKFKFDFTLFEGSSYAFPIRTPEFDLGGYFESARQLSFVPLMRMLLLALMCLSFVVGMFDLVFKI